MDSKFQRVQSPYCPPKHALPPRKELGRSASFLQESDLGEAEAGPRGLILGKGASDQYPLQHGPAARDANICCVQEGSGKLGSLWSSQPEKPEDLIQGGVTGRLSRRHLN